MTAVGFTTDEALLAGIEAHAIEIARGAGEILSHYFGKGKALDVEYKDKREQDPVTVADRESQEFLKRAILEKFPEHGVLGEEEDAQDREKGKDAPPEPAPDFLWVLDPLDGTKNFLNGLPVYACSIGVLHRGAPIAGALYLPWPRDGGGAIFHARRGGGAFMDAAPISVFESDEPKGNQLIALPGFFSTMFGFRKPMRGKVGELRMSGSIAYELAMTASGVLQYSMPLGAHLWDVAGGALLVMEAGGLVMRGHRTKELMGLKSGMLWEPMESLVPQWESGKTTLKELRRWRAAMVSGSPGVVRYVTSNLRTRLMLRRRLSRTAQRLRQRRKRGAPPSS
ncbi:MAG: inositol monophosphatase [Chloroflexi bacterium]|nr:inositol monophosphatase [Chloroflexota bacterium]